jgi:hypothetical protein
MTMQQRCVGRAIENNYKSIAPQGTEKVLQSRQHTTRLLHVEERLVETNVALVKYLIW